MPPEIRFVCPVVQNAPRLIYAMRHGESVGNAKEMGDESLKDQANPLFPLTDKGCNQVLESARYIRENKIIRSRVGLYSSGFLRTQQSMEIVLGGQEGRRFYVKVDSRLDEWWKGIFYSLSMDELVRNYPYDVHTSRLEGWHHYRPPQGQAGKDVEMNLLSFTRDVPENEILIAGHGRSFGFLRRLLTNQPVNLNCKYPNPVNGEIWKFARNGDYYGFESVFVPGVD